MKEKILRYKYVIYPIVIVFLGLILSLLNLNGSSVGRYSQIVYPEQKDENLIFGSPAAIRSDEYLLGTPILISQDINNEPIINTDIGEETNLGYSHNIPTRDIFTIFEPASWSFLFSDNTNLSFSIYWWARIVIMLVGTYLLFLELTNKNIALSIGGSLLFLLTPFVQWWLSADPMTPIGLISFGLYFFIKLLDSKNIFRYIAYSLALAYTIIAFALILYPPFQIPLAIVAIFIAIGILIKKRKEVFSQKRNVILLISSILFSLGIVISFIILFYQSFYDVISITMNTVYPGARFISPGQGNIYHLLNGFYDILLQKDVNTPPYGNQSETSNFFVLFIPLVVWVTYKNINSIIKEKKVDILGIFISIPLILFSLWYLLPLPDFISRYTGLYMVLPQRIFLGIGYANYILIIYILSTDFYKFNKKILLDKILLPALICATAILSFLTGKYLYSISPTFFLYPTFVPPIVKIVLVTILVPTLLLFLLKGYKKLFLICILLFGLISTIYINPLYKGLDILTKTDLAKYIRETSENDDSKWIVYGNHYYAQYALANNAHIINGIHLYPQFYIWKIIDPEEKYLFSYNRYAHIRVSEYTDGEELVELTEMDSIELNIDPCDTILKQLDIKYILSTHKLEKECLVLIKEFEIPSVYIYNLN